ncbi:MAG: hypothetical protein WDN06_13610 [Asticcacaulis sp.]
MGLVANRGVFAREFLREHVYIVSVRENSTPGVRQGLLDHSLSNLFREADAATALWSHGQGRRFAPAGRRRDLARRQHRDAAVAADRQFEGSGRAAAVGAQGGPGRFRQPRLGPCAPGKPCSASPAWRHAISRSCRWWPITRRCRSAMSPGARSKPLLGGHSDVAILYGAKGLELARSAHLKTVHRFEAETIRADIALRGLVELRALTVDEALLEGRARHRHPPDRQPARSCRMGARFPQGGLAPGPPAKARSNPTMPRRLWFADCRRRETGPGRRPVGGARPVGELAARA